LFDLSNVVVRIGFLSTAKIGVKNAGAIRDAKLSGTGISVDLVGSRSLDKAQKFATDNGILKACGSYQEVIDDPDIDAVYIPLPTTFHKEWVAKAARAKKSILCEKPCSISAAELLEMLTVCRENNVFFMDGVMFMHNNRYQKITQEEHRQRFGREGPSDCTSSFSFPGNEEFFKSNIRVSPKLDPLGCLGDLGYYNIRFALGVFGWTLPNSVSAHINLSKDNVPIDTSTTLFWDTTDKVDEYGLPSVKTATFHCSFRHQFQQWVKISSSTLSQSISDFVLPTNNAASKLAEDKGGKWVTDSNGTSIAVVLNEVEYPTPDRQEVFMWKRFACIVAEKAYETHCFWPAVALANHVIIDAILNSASQNGKKVTVDPENLMDSFWKAQKL